MQILTENNVEYQQTNIPVKISRVKVESRRRGEEGPSNVFLIEYRGNDKNDVVPL